MVSQLVQCIECTPASTEITLVLAFQWSPATYQSELCTLFPNVRNIHAAHFHRIMDILLIGQKVGLICTVEVPPALCAVKVGRDK